MKYILVLFVLISANCFGQFDKGINPRHIMVYTDSGWARKDSNSVLWLDDSTIYVKRWKDLKSFTHAIDSLQYTCDSLRLELDKAMRGWSKLGQQNYDQYMKLSEVKSDMQEIEADASLMDNKYGRWIIEICKKYTNKK